MAIGTMGRAKHKMLAPGNNGTVRYGFNPGVRRTECSMLIADNINVEADNNNKQNNACPLQEFQHGFVIAAPKIKISGRETIVL
jgi:hypothetical protein